MLKTIHPTQKTQRTTGLRVGDALADQHAKYKDHSSGPLNPELNCPGTGPAAAATPSPLPSRAKDGSRGVRTAAAVTRDAGRTCGRSCVEPEVSAPRCARTGSPQRTAEQSEGPRIRELLLQSDVREARVRAEAGS